MLPYALARPLLFCLDAEIAHELTLASLQRFRCLLPTPPQHGRTHTVMGIKFPNRVGLAAGLDKNGEAIDGLAKLGFGFLEIGTVTPRAQPGNPRPRLFRLPEKQALINRMGFNNHGVEALLANIRSASYSGILGINIGKNAATPIARATEDYLACLERVYAVASYVAVNISSPNTENLRELQGAAALDALLTALKTRQRDLCEIHGRYVPLAVKIAPDLDQRQITAVADALRRHAIDAVIATNTTVARAGVAGVPHAKETGGLSGAPLFEPSTAVVAKLAQALCKELPIIAVGGIMDGRAARAKLDAGADLVQLYSGLIYRGPDLVRDCVAATAIEEDAR